MLQKLEIQEHAEKACEVNADLYAMEKMGLKIDQTVFNINLMDGPQSRSNVASYFKLCADHSGMHVTTSCFCSWRQNKKTNGFAKVIPAISPGLTLECKTPVRVFFFDDNLEWDGKESSAGICNLRDVASGSFVDFFEGCNGFKRDYAAFHTVIHHSSEYRVVLVKANILDAMVCPDYFSDIVERYSTPDEKKLIFMDVNSTIVCNDTVQGKNLAETLTGTMFEFIEFRPYASFELHYECEWPLLTVRVEKVKTLKQLVKEVTADNHDAYSGFWHGNNSRRFFQELTTKGRMNFASESVNLTPERFESLFQKYYTALEKETTKDGICASWFRVFEKLKDRNSLVLNSFGVDTRKVVLATVPDESQVIQITVNHELWDARDAKKFEQQFLHA